MGWRSVIALGSDRYTLVTLMAPEVCAAKLRARTESWSPATWFASTRDIPFAGSVSRRGFSLKIRHFAMRPTMLDAARGSFRDERVRTLVDIQIGLDRWDRFFACASVVAIAGSWLVLGVLLPAVPPLLLAIAAGTTLLVRAVGRNDRERLLRIITDLLDARVVEGAPPTTS